MRANDAVIDQIETLYRRHGAALVLYAAAIGGDRGRAQYVVHQVFLRVLENGALIGVANERAWLFACVRNAALNDRAIQQRSAPLNAEAAWFSPPGPDVAEEESLRRALRILPDDQRQVVVMHIWGELTFSEIAGVLSISANTAASRYRYALAKLRDELRWMEAPNVRSG